MYSPERGVINFVTLGHGGVIELGFGGAAIYDVTGNDFSVWETSWDQRGQSCEAYPEKIRVEATQDGVNWVSLAGEACRDGSFDLASGGLE